VACRVVCISRADGAGGGAIGRLVAEQLGYEYVDEEIVARAAAKGGISAGEVADEERRRSAVQRLLTEMSRSVGAESFGMAGLVGTQFEETPDAIRAVVKDAIEEVGGRGNAVIVSHGASFVFPGQEDVLRVLVTASPETRARRLGQTRELAPRDAEKAVKGADAARADYLRRFHGVPDELPTHYDLVVNTDVVTVERAADLVVLAAR
jgi:cytidylate kinase